MKDDRRERRNYFRIDDEIHLEYQLLEEKDYQQLLQSSARDGKSTSSLAGQLQHLNLQAGSLLVQIRKHDTAIAQYLALLDRKIELLARQLSSSQSGQPTIPSHKVDLSGSGITFYTDEKILPGCKLSLQMLLFPDLVHIQALGRVIHCTALPAGKPHAYRIGTEFTRIDESMRDALIRHTLELQSARLREGRQS